MMPNYFSLEASQPETLAKLSYGGGFERLSTWLLFMLSGARRTGLAPLDANRLHLLLFYGAVLTPVYGLEQPVPLIVKVDDAPYYPEAQEAVERLVVSGMVINLGRRRIGRNNTGHKRLENDRYDLASPGLALVELLRRPPASERLYSFAHDLCKGFSEIGEMSAEDVAAEDALLRDDSLQNKSSAWIKRTGTNRVLEAARWIADYEEAGGRPNKREEVALYFLYLQELRRRAA
ncbi:hypothetical protein [Azospirillum brasilense]|uniref:hypothetical protein n=1 Tax=Azospirillum brasilense TaxID=192 RepID=UPI001EDA3F30|nr:hypothetical protein [Azospirillum brasilense]UKJ73259.1 hypothetical protein H1Q64_01135 [Azospirillum brasilense]UKJ75459.1 hypothetical protein H1Q64_14500 [Azospirillum brasilense]